MLFRRFYITANVVLLSTAAPAIPAAIADEMSHTLRTQVELEPPAASAAAAAEAIATGIPLETAAVMGMPLHTVWIESTTSTPTTRIFNPSYHIPIPVHTPTTMYTAVNDDMQPVNPESLPLPGTCYVWLGKNGLTQLYAKQECYTRTTIVPAKTCEPLTACSPRPTDLICPLYIKESKTTLPCETDCCPNTSTVTRSVGPCPTCDPCHIPTEWTTYFTGCSGTSTITHIATITPAF